MWIELKTEQDMKTFMKTMGCFHDSCIKEIYYLSGAYVNADLSMYPMNDVRVVRVVIQRQHEDNSLIEMEFGGVRQLCLVPINSNYTCEILKATLVKKENFIYWCDNEELPPNNCKDFEGTLICASKLKWRVLQDSFGPEPLYIMK